VSNDPETIRQEIEATRASLSRNVDALTDNVTPRAIARHQVDKAGHRMRGIRDQVMGTASDVSTGASDRAAAAGDLAANAKATVGRQARGNPLAAGAVALAAGWLVGSLLPASQRETQLAGDLKDRAAPLIEETKAAVQESAGNLKEPAQQAAASLKESATGAVESVKAQASDAAQDVKSSSQASAQQVKDSATSG
jgi:ElaB/YqjD/DUF883 family membrane-anchored ribosome-binding protein